MFYVKSPFKKREEKTFKIDRIGDYADISYNFALDEYTSASGLGISLFPILYEGNVKTADIFKFGADTMAIGTDNAIYKVVNNHANIINNATFIKKPEVIGFMDGELKLIATDGNTSILIEGNKTNLIKMPDIKNLSAYKGMIFGSRDNILYFSNVLKPEFWKGEGNYLDFIELQNMGNVMNILPYLDVMYVFCERGIARIDAYGGKEGFSVDYLEVPFNKYNKDTAKSCGEIIMFSADNSLYKLKDLKVTETQSTINNRFIDFIDSSSAYFGGNYYVTCRITDTYPKNAIICYNVKSEKAYLMKCGKVKLTKENYVINTDTNLVGKIERSATCFCNKNVGYWKSLPLNLACNGKKVLYDVYVNCLKDVTLSVSNGKQKKTFRIKNDVRKAKIDMVGQYFTLEIKSDASSFIDSIEFVYGV